MAETTETKDTTVTTTEEKGKDTAGAGAGTSTNETPKAKTEEEIRAELQKEYEKMADKRVTDAIKKKEKEWADKAAKEKMTEDERKRVEEQERLQAQAKKDFELTIKGLRLDVVDAIAELGLDAGFRNLIAVEDLASISDEDERKKKLTERIKGMKSLYLKADSSNIEINVTKQKQYLESIGVDTSDMDEQAIKEANTGSHVFLKGTISILDAIEDIDIFINKE